MDAISSQRYKWGEWSLDGCMKEAYFNGKPIKSEICDYLKNNTDVIVQHGIHVIVLMPFVLMFLALITNIIFIFICILVLKDKNNPSQNLCIFLLTRSVTILIAQFMGYISVFQMDSRAQLMIFVFPQSLYAIANSGICIVLSIFIYLSTFHVNWYNKNVTVKKCLILNGIIWLFSSAFLILFELYAAFLLLFSKEESKCFFHNCENVFAYGLAVIYLIFFISIFQLIIVYIIVLIELNKQRKIMEKEYKYCGKQYVIATRRFFFNIIVFIARKIPFLVFSLMFLHSAAEIDEDSGFEEVVRFEVFINLSLNAAVAEMVFDPIITIAINYSMISKLVKKFFKKLFLR